MPHITWRDDFSIGDPAIDHEHKELIDFINGILKRLEQHGGDEETFDLLGQLYGMISSHFALEETIMRDHGYDAYEDHKNDHERLLDDIRDIMEFNEPSLLPAPDQLAELLSEWFSEHFRTKDARLHGKIHT